MHTEMSTIKFKRILNSDIYFSRQKYNHNLDKFQYLRNLIETAFIKTKIQTFSISINQLSQILQQIGITLNIQKLHQLFIYSTFDLNSKKKISFKQKMFQIVNQVKKFMHIDLAIQWIIQNINHIIVRTKQTQNKQRNNHGRMKTETITRNHHQNIKFPQIKQNMKFESQLQILIDIFDQMEKLRQSSGLVPINFDRNQNDIVQIPFVHIPFDPQLGQLNQSLFKLKQKAQTQLNKILQFAKNSPNIRNKLQAALGKFQKNRLQSNEKIGRIGAINAQRRLAMKKIENKRKYKDLKLDYDEDLIKAARVYSLLSIPDPIIKPVY